jgi:hypothetical protein
MANLGDLSGFKTYEDWQRANRAEGGSGDSAEVRSRYAPAPAAPTSFPSAPRPLPTGPGGPARGGTAAPAPSPRPAAPAPSGGGGTANFNSEFARQFDPSGRPVNLGNVDSSKVLAGTGASGYNAQDVTAYRKIDPNIIKNMTPEQRAVWSMENIDDLSAHGDRQRAYAQWLEWQKDYDPNCPPGAPYQAADGSGCVEKPDNTNKGYQAGVGGGGRGEGGGATAVAGGGGGDATGTGLAGMMETNLKSMLAGGSSRYSPEAMQGLLAQIKQRIESSKANQVRQAQSEAAGRGMSRSGRTGSNIAAINRGAEAEFTGQYGNVLRAKIDADRQDKLDALDRAQKYIDMLRDESYRRDMSAIQRQQFQANLDLAYANLANQRQALASSQQHQRDMLGAQYGYHSIFGGM